MTMKNKPNDLLLLAGKVLTYGGQGGLVLGGLAISVAAPMILIFKDEVSVEFANRITEVGGSVSVFTVVGLVAIAIGIIVLAFQFLGKLRAIIASVGDGDPFIPENAERLEHMAWLTLGIQLLLIPAAGLGLMLAKWADSVGNADVTIDAGIDLSGILMVVVLFILARVFKHGAAMREDLEGTV